MENRVPTDEVTENDVRKFINILTGVSYHWYKFGLQLNIKGELLKIIWSNHSCDHEAKLQEMLMERLHQGEPLTWGALVEALESVHSYGASERIKSCVLTPQSPVRVTQTDVQSGASCTHCDIHNSFSPKLPLPVSDVGQTPQSPPIQSLATAGQAPDLIYPSAQRGYSSEDKNTYRHDDPLLVKRSQGPGLMHLPAQRGPSSEYLKQHNCPFSSQSPYIPTTQVSVTQSSPQVSPPPAKQPRLHAQAHTQPIPQLSANKTVKDTDEVTKKDIRELLNFLNPVASKCNRLGLQLGVDSDDIDNIKEDHRECKDQLCEILKQRLKQEEPLTWGALIEALKSKSVGENRLAQEIKFIASASAQPDKPSVSSLEHHNTPSSSSQFVDPLHFKHQSSVETLNHQPQRSCRSRSRIKESPSCRSQKRKSPSSRSLSRSPTCRRESPCSEYQSQRKGFSSCKSRKNRSPNRRSQRRVSPNHSFQGSRSLSPKSTRVESPINPSQSMWSVERESHTHQSQRLYIQPGSPPTQATGSQINPPPAKQPRLQHQPYPQPAQHSAPQPATNQTVQDSRSPLDQYIDYVKTVYKKSEVERDTHTVKWPPTPSKVYINAVSINRKMSRGQMSEYNEVTKAMVQQGDVDVVHGTKWPINFYEIAAGGSNPQVVLVEGAPGVGKSTFAWEFCRRWERGEIAQQYQLVLLLRLRDEQMSRAKTLGDLIYHSSESVHQAVVTHLEHSLGLNILFILEGFDELPDASRSERSVFLQLIHGKLLPHATVMVTSRPWAVEFLIKRYGDRISQHIEILGFTSEQISDYIESVLSATETKDLETYIRYHPNIKGCMYIPLNTAIVVTVYQESQASGCPMPTTLTELYIALVQTLILRYLQGHQDLESSKIKDTIGTLGDMCVPCCVKKHFTVLCSLAYKGILGTKDHVQLIFGESDLPAGFDNLGFMDSVTELYVTRGTVSSHI